MAKTEKLIPFILSWEGGYVNDPNDRGGATNKGVTIAIFRTIFGASKTVEDLKNMTDEQWLTVFRSHYFWGAWDADKIKDQNLANILVDWVWASGNSGIKIPQQLLGVEADGNVGDITMNALNNADPKKLFTDIWNRRVVFLKRICAKRPANCGFMKGWMRRLNGIQYGRLICNNGKIITC